MSDQQRHPGGRPRLISSPAEFEERALAYFDECRTQGVNPTVTGLALSVGFCDRQSIYDYQNRPEFSGVVKWARLVVENAYERRLSDSSAGGAIFALKNMGWADRTQHEHSGPDGGPIAHRDVGELDDEELERRAKALRNRLASVMPALDGVAQGENGARNGSGPSTNGAG